MKHPALTNDIRLLAGIFAVSGTIHLVRPEVYEPIIPRALPAHRELVLGSGVVELLCAAGLAVPRTRAAAGWLSVAVLLGVFPANVKMANDAQRRDNTVMKVGTLARLPLQLPMIRSALRATGARR